MLSSSTSPVLFTSLFTHFPNRCTKPSRPTPFPPTLYPFCRAFLSLWLLIKVTHAIFRDSFIVNFFLPPLPQFFLPVPIRRFSFAVTHTFLSWFFRSRRNYLHGALIRSAPRICLPPLPRSAHTPVSVLLPSLPVFSLTPPCAIFVLELTGPFFSDARSPLSAVPSFSHYILCPPSIGPPSASQMFRISLPPLTPHYLKSTPPTDACRSDRGHIFFLPRLGVPSKLISHI